MRNPYLENAINKILEIRPKISNVLRNSNDSNYIKQQMVEITYTQYFEAILEIRKGLTIDFPSANVSHLVPDTIMLQPALVEIQYVVTDKMTFKNLVDTRVNPLEQQLRAVGNNPPIALLYNLFIAFWCVFFHTTLDATTFSIPTPLLDTTSANQYTGMTGNYVGVTPSLTDTHVKTFMPMFARLGEQSVIDLDSNNRYLVASLFCDKDKEDGFEQFIRLLVYDFFRETIFATYAITLNGTIVNTITLTSSSITLPSKINLSILRKN